MKKVFKFLLVLVVFFSLTLVVKADDPANPDDMEGENEGESSQGSTASGGWDNRVIGLKVSVVDSNGNVKTSKIIGNRYWPDAGDFISKYKLSTETTTTGGVARFKPKYEESDSLYETSGDSSYWGTTSIKSYGNYTVLPDKWEKNGEIIVLYDILDSNNYAVVKEILEYKDNGTKIFGEIMSSDYITIEPMTCIEYRCGTMYELAKIDDSVLSSHEHDDAPGTYYTWKEWYRRVLVGMSKSLYYRGSGLHLGTTVNVATGDRTLSLGNAYTCLKSNTCGLGIGIYKYSDLTAKGSLTIKKVNSAGTALSGARLKVTGPNSYSRTFTTTTSATVLEDLELGTYTIEELEAPQGYSKVANKTVTITDANLDLTVTLTDELTKVRISKKAETGDDELPGAELEVQDRNGNVVKYCIDAAGNKNKDCKWTSGATAYEIEGMPKGTYYLVETKAPSTYGLNSNKVEFTVTDDGTITEVEMRNNLNKVVISKVKSSDNKALPGSKLEIQDASGTVVKYCTDSEGNKNKDCKWTSGEEVYEIEGMPNGTYYLVETEAPEGYKLNTEKVEFVVDGSVATVNVTMKNALNKVAISKVSAKDNKALSGAKLEIQDKDGKVVKYCVDSEGNKNKDCKWTSGATAYEIEGMPKGTYYLVETEAPEGYELNTEKVEFVVNSDEKTIEVKMTNEVKVEVPDTMSSKSILLVAVAMLDIALGIGIITYVKKNKIEE